MELLKIPETAARLRISDCVLRRWIAKGAIPYHRLGKQYYFTESDLQAYIDACAVHAAIPARTGGAA
jgi:excisionase family DNA binding protein